MNEEWRGRIEAVIRKIDDFEGEYETAFVYETMQAELDDLQTDVQLALDRMSEEDRNGAAGEAARGIDALLDEVLDAFEEVLEKIEEYVEILDEDGKTAARPHKKAIAAQMEEMRDNLEEAAKL